MKIKKLIIILGCCIITLFSLVFVGCKRENAKANVISGNYLLELPLITTTLIDNNIVIPNMFIGEDNNGKYIYYLYSDDGLQAYYKKEYFGTGLYLHYVFNVASEGSNYTNYNGLTDMSNGFSYLVQGYSNISINYIINNAVKLDVVTLYDVLEYRFYDINNDLISYFSIDNIKPVASINETFQSFNVLLGQFDMSDFNAIYIDGYQEGYINGYNLGAIDGFGATTPFDVFVNSINSFLSIELFGGFSISTMLSIAFGLILLGIVIKVFLGG